MIDERIKRVEDFNKRKREGDNIDISSIMKQIDWISQRDEWLKEKSGNDAYHIIIRPFIDAVGNALHECIKKED